MWNRVELKRTAKERFTANYWLCVIVAVVITLITGRMNFRFDINLSNIGASGWKTTYSFESLQAMRNLIGRFLLPSFVTAGTMGALASIAFAVFVGNPLTVGGRRFFVENVDNKGELKHLLTGFDGDVYLKNVVTMLLMLVYIVLWSLLLVIPGIIKACEYWMVPYLLADRPELTRQEAFAESRRMMRGNKMRAFALYLSFFWWYILSVLTAGLAYYFYVGPYIMQTEAQLYRTLRDTPTEAEY